MKAYYHQFSKGFALIASIILLSSCASSREASIPQGWRYNVNWDHYTTAQVTPSDHIIIQNKEDMIMLDGSTGEEIERDVRERGGFFSEMGRDIKEQMKESAMISERINAKYFYKELPGLNTILLFNRSDENDAVRSLNLKTGEEQWKSTSYRWNLDEYRDIANIAIDALMEGALGAKATSEFALQTRLISSMIEQVPERKAFLFRTVEKLYMIDNDSGDVLWSSERVDGTGIAKVEYLPEKEELLIVTNMAGLKDLLKNADESESLKQVLRLNAQDGDILWQSEYKGRSKQVRNVHKKDDVVHLVFEGGYVELFDANDGERIFGTRDEALDAGSQVASFSSEYNGLETPETGIPQFDGDMVFAVNPHQVRAVGVPDKTITKFNYKTGEKVWQKELEKAWDIRDMHLTNKNVTVRVSPVESDSAATGTGKTIGGSKDYGLYSYSKEDGELRWKLTEPFGGSSITNAIYEGSYVWLGGGDRLYKVDTETGDVVSDSLITKEGFRGNYLRELPNNRLLVIGSGKIAVIRKDDSSPVFVSEMDGNRTDFQLNDEYLIVKTDRLMSSNSYLHVYNLTNPKLITSFTLSEPDQEIAGGFKRKEYEPTNDFSQIITMTENGFKSYKVY